MKPVAARAGSHRPDSSAFVLLEALLAVAIFALGIISLGRCVSNCVAAERLKSEDMQARRVLENRVAEIEAGVVPLGAPLSESLPPPLTGWKLTQTSASLEKRNERDQSLAGLQVVTLEVSWSSAGESPVRSRTFYVQPRVR